jgi:pimeloyl-ACP methyl ester carboxylesterase
MASGWCHVANVINVLGRSHGLLDVVFLHGLGGDARTTWSSSGWPGWLGWLGEDIPEITIWTVDYEGAPSKWWRRSSALPIVDRATNLSAVLENSGIGQRPVCFVVHSMGGLVLKEMLLDSNETPLKLNLARATRAVVFLSTPHSGSHLATFADRFRKVYRGSPAIVDLRRDNAHLRKSSNRYRDWAASSPVQHLVFFETALVNGFLVVDQSSSDPGLTGVRPIPVDANHTEICKLDSRENVVYGQIRNLIRATLKQDVVEVNAQSEAERKTLSFPNSDSNSASPALLHLKTRDASGRSIEIKAFDHESVSIIARAFITPTPPEGSLHD